MSRMPLPIRLAAAPLPQEETTSTPETPSIYTGGARPGPSPSPLVAEAGDAVPLLASPELRLEAAAGPSNHQFWLKDAKIAEDLFTIHRSAKHLVEFTASIIGNNDPSIGHQPIPVMSDGDVLFMTQLSNDIARSVGGISAVRHHGMRTKKRKTRHQQTGAEPHFAREYLHNRPSRESREDRTTSGSKRLNTSKDDDELFCQKCHRTDTPEWRKGPEGLLCNVCGLMYAKQRRKLKGG